MIREGGFLLSQPKEVLDNIAIKYLRRGERPPFVIIPSE